MALFSGKKGPSQEAKDAQEAAEASTRQALSDLIQANEKLRESLPIIKAIRDHNEQNHYDDFFRELAMTNQEN